MASPLMSQPPMAPPVKPPQPGEKQPVPLAAEGTGSRQWWEDQIQAAEDKIDRMAESWRKNLDRYLAQPLSERPVHDTVVVPIDFANVEQKKAQLYFKNPEVQLSAWPGHQAEADPVQAFGWVLNEELGPDGCDTETMMDEMLMDVLCPSGIGFTVMGIDVTTDGTKPVITGYQDVPQQGAVLGLQTVQQPIVEQAPNIIHQRYFWDRISPLAGLVPARFHGSNFDKAPWLGYRFEMDREVAIKKYKLTAEEAARGGEEPKRLNKSEQQRGDDTTVMHGYCIFYKAALYRDDVKHPEEIWRLTIMKGVDRVLTHDRPYQQYAKDGRTLIGLRGFPMRVYVPRYVSDSAFPPSDCQMSRHQADELSKGRSQMIQQRERAKPMRQINTNLADPDTKEQLKNGTFQGIIMTTSSEPIALEIAHATYPRENFEFNRITKADISETWAFGANQRGNAEDTRRTATELSIQQQNSDTRMEKERNRLAKWYSKGAECLAGLIQLFEDEREEVAIVGQEGEQKLVQWDRTALPLRFVCTAKPDTMVRTDSAGEFKRALDLYQMTANDPNVNRVELLTAVFRKANYDPSKIVVRQLPAKGPEPPRISVAFSGDDFNPAMPQFPIVQQLLTAGGIQIDPQNVALGLDLHTKTMMQGGPAPHSGASPVPGQPPPNGAHGGAAEQQNPLSKHSTERTGKLPGDGMTRAVN